MYTSMYVNFPRILISLDELSLGAHLGGHIGHAPRLAPQEAPYVYC